MYEKNRYEEIILFYTFSISYFSFWGIGLECLKNFSFFPIGKAFCTETRPYNQGARLTAYELVYEKIPSVLICDSMAAALMNSQKIHAVVVGADRVTRNGDTANKIGTYQVKTSLMKFQIVNLIL